MLISAFKVTNALLKYEVVFVNINALWTNTNKQWTLHLLHYLLMLVNEKQLFIVYSCSQCINVNKYNFIF